MEQQPIVVKMSLAEFKEDVDEMERLRTVNKELLESLTDIIEACSPPGVPNIHYILKRAKEAVKAKGQGGE